MSTANSLTAIALEIGLEWAGCQFTLIRESMIFWINRAALWPWCMPVQIGFISRFPFALVENRNCYCTYERWGVMNKIFWTNASRTRRLRRFQCTDIYTIRYDTYVTHNIEGYCRWCMINVLMSNITENSVTL